MGTGTKRKKERERKNKINKKTRAGKIVYVFYQRVFQ